MVDGVVSIAFPGQSAACRPEPGSLRTLAVADFLIGPENRLAEPAVYHLLHRCSTAYNPLVLYGASGTGKSHLVRGLAAAWKARFPSRRLEFTTASDFARELADAVEAQAVDDLRLRYRTAALLIIENIGELAVKQAAQEELIHTLDAVLREGGQVVVTAAVAPVDLDGLLPALQSRLIAGLSVPLAAPGPAARMAILQRLAATREVELAESVARLLAEGLNGTVPQLMGALAQLELPARELGRSIEANDVREYLAKRNGSRQPDLRDIAAAAARHFSLKLADLRGPSRRRPVVTARDLAMYLARSLTASSLCQIGEYFGGRDHTTVMHGCRKMEKLIKIDAAVRQAVEQLQQRFESGVN